MRSAFLSALCLTALLALITGCGLTHSAISSAGVAQTETPDGADISGTAFGGQQPIVGGKVYLLAANDNASAGHGIAASSANASISLLNPAKTGNVSDSVGSYVNTAAGTGGFQLSGDYSCTTGFLQGTTTTASLSGTEEIYLYVLGGNPGAGTNGSIGLLAALGPCNSPATKIAVNEITTIATAFAIEGYASDALHISSDAATNATYGTLVITGITNAFANVPNLVNLGAGTAASTTVNTLGTVPTANIITLANILAACVNGTTANANCTTLFSGAESSGTSGTKPAETATAAINIAHNPATVDIATLFGLQPAIGTPFAGGLTVQPSTFLLPIAYNSATSSAFGPSTAVAVDSTGRALFLQLEGNGSVFYIEPGAGAHGLILLEAGGNAAMAVDNNNDIYVAGGNIEQGNLVTEYTSTGSPIQTFDGGGISSPNGIALNGVGDLWVSSQAAGLTEFNSLNAVLTGSNGLQSDQSANGQVSSGLTVDGAGDVWSGRLVVGSGGSDFNEIAEYSSSRAQLTTDAQIVVDSTVTSMAVDSKGTVWATVHTGFDPAMLVAINQARAATTYTASYSSLCFDGGGTLWAIGNGLTALNSSADVILEDPAVGGSSLAVDGSGNIWLANSTATSTTIIYEVIGGATPVITPISAGLPATPNVNGSSSLATRP